MNKKLSFPNLEELIFKIYENKDQIDEDLLKNLKREYSGKYKLKQLPTNIQLLNLYLVHVHVEMFGPISFTQWHYQLQQQL